MTASCHPEWATGGSSYDDASWCSVDNEMLAASEKFSGQEEIMLWPLLVYFALVILTAAGMLGVSYVLGQRHHDRATATPYESGIAPEGSARVRLSAKFYLIAMFFVVFDIEAVFIFTWAVVAREAGWAGFWEILLFIAILAAVLVYLWRIQALDWEPMPRKYPKST